MRRFDNINVIPFIDILLVLLAIVLTTATFVSSGQLDINLPEASSSAAAEDFPRIEIAVNRQNVLYMDGIEMRFDDIETELKQVDESTHITLVIDKAVEFGRFVRLIDLLKTLSLNNVSIETRAIN